MQDIPCPQNPNHADQDPKRVEQGICLVLLENGAPGKQNCIDGVEDPHEHERAGRSQPADQAETEDPHQHADHFNRSNMFQDEGIDICHFDTSAKNLAKYTRPQT